MIAVKPEVSVNRRTALGLFGAGVAAATLPDTGWATAAASHPLLGTPDQQIAERLIMRLARDPDVVRLQAQIKAELLLTDIGKTPAGIISVDRAVQQWTYSEAFAEIGVARKTPTFLWGTDDTPRSWFGYTLAGVGSSGDNPDNVYRTAVIDGTKNYEVLGWKDLHNPAEQLVIQIDKADLTNPASMFDMKSKMPSVVGATLALLSDKDLKVAPDGSFRITLGSGQPGLVHVPLKPGRLSIGTRDLLASWRQRPSKLIVREIGANGPIALGAPEALEYAAIKRQLIADLPGYIRFWGHFPDIWFGGLKPNTISAPRGRVGGWGFVAGLNYALAPDEAAIVTTTQGAAAYTGFQINDPWMIQPDAKRYQVCLNSSQTKSSPDGSVTYVVAHRDPEVANWIDTTGLSSGIGILRWQKVPADMKGDGLIREYRVIKMAEVAGMTQLPRVTPAQRRAEIDKRAGDYESRAT